MGDIVTFPKTEETETPEEDTPLLVMLCGACEGSTFRVLSSGELECSICGSRCIDDLTGIKYDAIAARDMDHLPPERNEYPTVEIAFERTLRKASVDKTAGLVVMNMDGRTHVWSIGAEDDEHVQWYKTRVDELLEMLTK